MTNLRVKQITPHWNGGPVPEPITVLVDENNKIVAVRKRMVRTDTDYSLPRRVTHNSYEYWEYR